MIICFLRFLCEDEEMKEKYKGIGTPTYHLGDNFKHLNEPKKIPTQGAMTYVKRMMAKHKSIFMRKLQKGEVHASSDPPDQP